MTLVTLKHQNCNKNCDNSPIKFLSPLISSQQKQLFHHPFCRLSMNHFSRPADGSTTTDNPSSFLFLLEEERSNCATRPPPKEISWCCTPLWDKPEVAVPHKSYFPSLCPLERSLSTLPRFLKGRPGGLIPGGINNTRLYHVRVLGYSCLVARLKG